MDAILFDFDGTLLDSFDDIVDAMNHTLEAVGRPRLPEATVRGHIGDGLPHLVAGCLDAAGGGGDAPAQVEAFIARFKPWYAAHWLDRSGLYPGVPALLEGLVGRPMGLVSNKPEAACRELVTQLGIASYFGAVAGGDTYPERKPDPGPVRRTLERLAAPAATATMVGDGPQDMRAGRAAGVRCVGVSWGLHPAATLEAAGAHVVVDTVEALAELLARA